MSTPTTEQVSERERAINNLRSRARRARNKIRWIIGLLLLGVAGVIAVSFSESKSYTARANLQIMEEIRAQTSSPTFGVSRSPETNFQNKLSALVNQQIGPLTIDASKPQLAPRAQYDQIDQDIDRTLQQYAKAVSASIDQARAAAWTRSPNWESLISTLFINIGAISFSVMFIQMAFTFVRYYAQLAEIYDAQADAFVAAAGDQDRAAKFLEQFSPKVEFGRTPGTIYEKAFQAVTKFLAAAKTGN